MFVRFISYIKAIVQRVVRVASDRLERWAESGRAPLVLSCTTEIPERVRNSEPVGRGTASPNYEEARCRNIRRGRIAVTSSGERLGV
jgi:hypothetical protein